MDYRTLKAVTTHVGVPLNPTLGLMHVYGGRLQVNNGRYTVDVPTDLPDMTVNADRFTAAWAACNDPVAGCTDTHCVVKERRVRARIALANAEGYPLAVANAPTAHTAPGIAAMLTSIEKYVATDASRPWAMSMCVHNGFIYATNNVVLVRVPFVAELPGSFNLPSSVFDAISERGEPSAIGVDGFSCTFHYGDTSWVRTTLIAGEWPVGTVDGLLAGVGANQWLPVNPELALMLETAAKLSDARHPIVEFDGNGIRSIDGSFEAIDLEPVPTTGRVNAVMAALALRDADEVQWHSPRQDVHAFRRGELYGVLAGTR